MAEVGTTALIFKLATVDFSDAVSSVEVVAAEDSDGFGSFASVRAGGPRKYSLKMKIKQDTAAAGLWYYIWDNAGDEVAAEVWPCGGGTTPSSSNPKFAGTVVISEPNGTMLGGEAKRSASARLSVEVEWEFTAKPTLTIA